MYPEGHSVIQGLVRSLVKYENSQIPPAMHYCIVSMLNFEHATIH